MDKVKEQFSLIYDQYIEKIYRFVYLKVNSHEAAEDVTSTVFTKSWEYYQNNQEIKNVGAFLYKIARNDVINYYRDRDRTKVVSGEYASKLYDGKVNLHEKASLDSDMEVVRSAMQNLKKDYQDVIIWHYLEDMSLPEIAEIMDKPQGTVRVMIHRGLKELKNQLS